MARDKIKVLFVIGHEYHRAALDPIYSCMKDRDRYDMSFTCTDEKERKWLIFQRSLCPQIEQSLQDEGLKTTKHKRGFDVVITGDILRKPEQYGDSLLCFVNHGTGIKTILYRLLSKHRDTRYLIFVEGDYRKKKIMEFEVQGASEIHVVGYSKLDPVFQGKCNKRDVMRKWNLDPSKKTVLFAPTYKPTCIDLVGEQILPATVGYNLIIKLHHYSWRGRYAPHWHHRLYEKAVRRYDHTRLIPPEEHSILPFIFTADTMLSEASSTIFEFLALGKVGIIFDLPCDHLKHTDGMPLLDEDNRRFLEGGFIHIKSPDEIRPAIETALNPDDAMKERLGEYRDMLFYKLDGRASERIVDIIENSLDSVKNEI